MKPLEAFLLFFVVLIIFFASLYYSFHYHYEFQAVKQKEVVGSSEIGFAHFKVTAAMLICVFSGIGSIGTFSFFIAKIVDVPEHTD